MNNIEFNKHDVDILSVFCNLIGRSFSHHVGFRKGQEAGLTLEGEVVNEIKVSLNRNGILFKKVNFKILNE
jgi:hypothetical protein